MKKISNLTIIVVVIIVGIMAFPTKVNAIELNDSEKIIITK